MPIPYLDTPEAVTNSDASNLVNILRELPKQVLTAVNEFSNINLPDWSKVNQVVFCGMGGSAIGAEVASGLPFTQIKKPILVVRDYALPAYVNKDSLVVVVSYSGDTEEALACFATAHQVGAAVIVITSGGELARLAQQTNTPIYLFNYQAPPRDAFGYLFAPLLRVLTVSEVINKTEADLVAALKELAKFIEQLDAKVSTDANPAKRLAHIFYDHVPLIFGSSLTAGVARRWSGQCNEHAKTASFFSILPELNHNLVEGFSWPARFKDDVVVVLLRSAYDHPQVKKRFEILKQFLNEQNIIWEEVVCPAADHWSEKLQLIALADWTSYYLALLYRTDPAPVPAIMSLKAKLK